MGCTAWEEQINVLADGELGDDEARALFGHLGGCVECRSFYRHLMLMREDLRGPAASVPVSAKPQKVSHTATGWPRMRPVRSPYVRISRSLAIAAVFLIIALGGSTAALVLGWGGTETRVVYVVGFPTIEVEATYLPANNKL